MFYKDNFCTAKIAKSANYAGSVCVCVCVCVFCFCFFQKIDENYASPIYQKLLENAGDATMLNSSINSLTLFHKKKIHDSHICITPLRVKRGIKSVPDLQAKTFVIYAAYYLHNYMILLVTSIEQFPRRRRQLNYKEVP